MRKRFGLAAIAALIAATASAQSVTPEPVTPPAGSEPAPALTPAAPVPTPAPTGPPVAIPVPAPVLRLVDPPVIAVETLPAENPFATVVEAAAMAPVKPVAADAVVPAALFVALRVDPKGKVVTVRRVRDPIPSLTAQTQASLLRWTFDPGRKAGQAVDSWASLRLDLSVEIDEPRMDQVLLTPITPSTPIPQPLDWGADAAWLATHKPAPSPEGTLAIEQLDVPSVPKKQPWSSSSYKGPFSVKFWVRINASGRLEKAIALQASDPVLLAYFRKAMDAWLFRPARAAGAAAASWNELTLGGQVSFDTELKLTASLRQSL
jgi:hypothetical protein